MIQINGFSSVSHHNAVTPSDFIGADLSRCKMQKHLRSTIIIIDDDVQVLRSLCFLLETEGYQVLTFSSAMDLLDHSELPESSCLVVDYRMPVMNGIDLMKRMREKYPDVPALIITGYPDDTIEAAPASWALM